MGFASILQALLNEVEIKEGELRELFLETEALAEFVSDETAAEMRQDVSLLKESLSKISLQSKDHLHALSIKLVSCL